MSGNPEFSIKISDIIGKAWLLSLDDSEDYVLSFKLIEHNSVQLPSTEKEEEKLTGTETNSQNTLETENIRNESRWKDGEIVLADIRRDFRNYFRGKSHQFRIFIEELNTYIGVFVIVPIEYENLKISKDNSIDNSIMAKINALIKEFDHQEKLPDLKEAFIKFKNSNL